MAGKSAISPSMKKEISRLRSEVRKLQETRKEINPFTGIVSGNYWTQTGMPWVSGEGRKAALTEYFWQPVRGQPRRVDTNELRQFSQTFWVNACVHTIVDEITSLDWDIVPKDGYDYDWVSDGITETKEFFTHPNHNGEALSTVVIRSFIKDILEIDAGVLVKVFDINSYDFNELEPKSGAPMLKPIGQRKMTEIYARDGASFLKEIDKFGFLKGYWQYSYQIPAHPMWFHRDEIVYCAEHSRSMSCYGYARTQAILDIVKSLHYSTLYNKRFFEETSIPDGALALLDTNEVEMKAFLNWWNGEFKAQPHKLAVINKDIKWQPFSVTNRELEFLETQKSYFKWIISMFGLTPAELGITEDLNRSTAATQAELSKRKGIRPFLKLIENSINMGIMPEFQYEGIEFQFIYDDPAEKHTRLENWKTELDMGVKTPNEVRVEMGMDPIEGGDILGRANPFGMLPQFPSEGGQKTEEESQTSGYAETLRTEEGNQKTDKETDEEVRSKIQRPYETASRPVGSFKGVPDPEQLRIGMEVEREHQASLKLSDREVEQIARDHLDEDPQYYSKLEEMEKIAGRPKTEEERRETHRRVYGPDSELPERGEGLKARNGKLEEIHGAIVRDGQAKDPWALAEWIYHNLVKGTEKSSQEDRWRSCVEQVSRRGGVSSPEAVCTAAVGHPLKSVDKAKSERSRQNKWHEMFYALQREGHSRESAARIATSRMGPHSDTERTAEDHERTAEHLHKQGYVMPVGQYYNDQPIATPRRPSGANFQPQNPKPGETRIRVQPPNYSDTFPSGLGSSYAKPGIDVWRSDAIRCPVCGQPTLTYLNSLEGSPDDVRCTACGSRFNANDLADARMLDEMSNVMQARNAVEPVSIPAIKPKGFAKKLDIDMGAKEYCGFDTSKSLPFSAEYAASPKYKKLMDKYLKGIGRDDVKKIIALLKNGMRTGKSLREIAGQIEAVVKDKNRAELITRTELVRLGNEGNLMMMEKRGVEKVKFIASPEDGRRCEECASMDGKIMDVEEAKGTLPIHPRCRCLYTEYYEQ